MISFKCKHCGKIVELKDELVGKYGPCPHCKKEIQAPKGVPATDDGQKKEGRSINAIIILGSSALFGILPLVAIGLSRRDYSAEEAMFCVVIGAIFGMIMARIALGMGRRLRS